jgi:HSP20 family protein
MNQLTTYDPFADAGIDELFRGFFRPVRFEKAGPAMIKMDVTEQDNAYVVKAEIPGVSKEDIQVSIEGNQVTIGAEVKREKDVKDGERVLRSERYYGSAYRAFTLPVEVDEATSNAKYESGVLELTLAKKPAQTGRKLTVQ